MSATLNGLDASRNYDDGVDMDERDYSAQSVSLEADEANDDEETAGASQ